MLPMRGIVPAVLLAIIWITALAGIAIKILWPGRFDRTSVAIYLVMGWSCLFAVRPVAAALAPVTFWLIGGGGVLFSVRRGFPPGGGLRFQQPTWLALVLPPAACDYRAVP